MRTLLWCSFLTITTGVLLLVSHGIFALTPPMIVALAIFYAIHPLGAVWMAYQCIRHEARPFPIILLVLVPYAFVWYYFERVRGGKQLLRSTNRDLRA